MIFASAERGTSSLLRYSIHEPTSFERYSDGNEPVYGADIRTSSFKFNS
jgi:hypothetical protein